MQLTNVSEGAAKAAAPQPYTLPAGVSYDKATGEYTDNRSNFNPMNYRLFGASSLDSIKEKHQAGLNEGKKAEDLPMWKKPFHFLGNAISNLLGLFNSAFKAVFFCFFKAEKAEGEGDAAKADEKAKPAKAESK